jgi:5'-nucleotidase
VAGTPSDAVLLAIHDLMPDKPDLVLSGVNRGQNIAEDTSFSGTVAAAMFGMQMGIRSVALSQAQNFRERGTLPWETAKAWGALTLRPLIQIGWPSDVVININFPDREPEDVRGIQITRQGFRDETIIHTDRREDLRGNDYYWVGYRGKLSKPEEGTDLRAVYDGYVSVSPLHVDLTHDATLKSMRDAWPR